MPEFSYSHINYHSFYLEQMGITTRRGLGVFTSKDCEKFDEFLKEKIGSESGLNELWKTLIEGKINSLNLVLANENNYNSNIAQKLNDYLRFTYPNAFGEGQIKNADENKILWRICQLFGCTDKVRTNEILITDEEEKAGLSNSATPTEIVNFFETVQHNSKPDPKPEQRKDRNRLLQSCCEFFVLPPKLLTENNSDDLPQEDFDAAGQEVTDSVVAGYQSMNVDDDIVSVSDAASYSEEILETSQDFQESRSEKGEYEEISKVLLGIAEYTEVTREALGYDPEEKCDSPAAPLSETNEIIKDLTSGELEDIRNSDISESLRDTIVEKAEEVRRPGKEGIPGVMVYTAEFKHMVALTAQSRNTTSYQLAKKYELKPYLVRKWKNQLIEGSKHIFDKDADTKLEKDTSFINHLHHRIGKLHAELEWLKNKQ